MNRTSIKKIILGLSASLSIYTFAQSQEVPVSNYLTQDLLCSYLENDLELKKLALEVNKSELSLEGTKIDQGLDINLSTGTMTFYSSGDGTSFSIKPSASVSIAKAKNFSAKVSTDYQVDTKSDKNTLKDTKFSVGIDLLSSDEIVQKVNLLKSERTLIEAKRNLETEALNTEKKFYTELENILNQINSIYTYRQDLFTDSLNFDKIKAQGYSKTSPTYRLAEMKVMTGEHNIQTATHSVNHDIILFYKHCGKTISVDSDDFLSYIPYNIPEVRADNFLDYDKDSFVQIENACWTHEINELSRKADKFFTLGITGGYTINNSTTNSDSIDAGINTIIGGIGLNAGISMPLKEQDFSPAFTFSANINPNTFRKRNLTQKSYELTSEQELLDIQTANQNYDNAVVDYAQSAINLNWEKESVKESYDLYQKNEEELLLYYNKGIVTKSEYLSAKNNRQLYQVKIIINKIKFIVYNNEVKSQFVDLETESK